ncbi:hypothetical protein ABZ611_08990 [Streptomyces sp. NPDC007861]|uniref:hypothetical protein n=1 Tax=Streptomyces sp. NPDC007861 TaxID=3154893 RepID=UPI0033D55AB5
MLDLTVRGLWGPREEDVDQLASRLSALLGRLAELAPEVFSGWRGTDSDAASLASFIEAANTQDDDDRVNWIAILEAEQEGMPKATVTMRAGGTSPWVPLSLNVQLKSRTLEEAAVPVAARLPEVLLAVADTWDADWGDVHDDDLFFEVEDAFDLVGTDPRAGRAVFLSARRAAQVPEELPGRRLPTAHGGLVIAFGGPEGQAPDAASVIAATETLRKAGALEPLPRPADRATW